MRSNSRLIAAAFAAVLIGLPFAAGAGSHSHLLDEDAALALLGRTLKHDGVYTHRISLDCVSYGTEETTDAYFQFVLREIHNAKCGGAPEVSPVVDRYRVYRRAGEKGRGEAIGERWPCFKPAQN